MMQSRTPLSRVVDGIRDAGLLVAKPETGEVTLLGVSQDSRRVQPGDLFLAWCGTAYDGHDFLADAVRRGAIAAVVERGISEVDIPQIHVSDGRLAGSIAADLILDSPWKRLSTVGVTGTNGKTTTAIVARHLLAAKAPAAAIGTLGLVGKDGRVRPGTEGLTTPGPVQLSSWLRGLADGGVQWVVVEASSHALAQRRMDGMRFDIAVFTNISQDHLDYHTDLQEYIASKARLLDLLKDGGTAAVNQDDRAWDALPDGGPRVSWGFLEVAEVRGEALDLREDHSRFVLHVGSRAAPVRLPLVGSYNVANAVAAAAVAVVAGLDVEEIAFRLQHTPQVPGRLEVVHRSPFLVLIDFAHTPDALARLLDHLRPTVRGRMIVLFGAGGDRDRGKRPLMGRVVSERADLAIVTSDNPRSEDPDSIIHEVVSGMASGEFLRITDRRAAIGRALELAQPGDLVLLAGKGHERYQVVREDRLPFDERVVVREFLASTKVS
jgi:UDP-N-acetylmuramoyl-L-alanyl-D-glutamate--2,6-diaminopimelate ligase